MKMYRTKPQTAIIANEGFEWRTAIDGYKKDEVFYVRTAPGTYKQVDKMDWYYNFILSIIMLISGGCIVLLYGYFGVRYFYPWIKYKYYEDIYDPDKQEYLT